MNTDTNVVNIPIWKNTSLENLPNEIWKPVVGYELTHEVSNLGRIKSLSRKKKHPNGGFSVIQNRVLKQAKTRGYPSVVISLNGVNKTKKTHRLVAIAFIPNTYNKPTVNHIDLNKDNNCVENLEWSTVRENTSHYFKNKITKSKYIGVCESSNGKWLSYIHFEGNRRHLGVFDDEKVASKMYEEELKKINE